MPLAAGTRLGPYEILSPLGKGGMGEVYRARDTKLDRDVAIKVLPDELAADEERVARFQREAKLLASLNHPNIASIYGFESHALVLELVEGPTLAERIEKGPIPVDEAISIAKQIAEALEAGHDAGVIHRDLKPANIKVREDGTVKVLDYGLAKALEGDAPSGTDSELSQSPTLTRQGTQVGVILGTAAYMSPEQAKGKPVDRRADIWAFGAVLYEMLTGSRAFAGEDVSDTLAAVLRTEPAWDLLPAATPANVSRLLRRCLAKEQRERLHATADARIELNDEPAGPVTADTSTPSRVGTSRTLAVAVGSALLAGAAVYLGFANRDSGRETRAHLRMSLEPAERLASRPRYGRPAQSAFAISPDGSTVVFRGASESGIQLYRRALDREQSVAIPGSEDGDSPFFSPDGSSIAFFASGLLKKVSLDDGAAVTLYDLSTLPPAVGVGSFFPVVAGSNFGGGSWGDDDHIVFALLSGGLWRIRSIGGEPSPLTSLGDRRGEHSHRLPQVLPGSRAVLFTTTSVGGPFGHVEVESFETGERRVLIEDASDARYSPTGHLLFVRSGTLMSVPFDADRLEVTGPVEPELEGVMQSLGGTSPGHETRAAQFSVSGDGTLVYLKGGTYPELRRAFVWVDRAGNSERLDLPTCQYVGAQLSSSQRRIVTTARDDRGLDVFVLDVDRANGSRVTSFGTAAFAIWSPDGDSIAFGDFFGGSMRLPANAAADPDRFTQSESAQSPSSWSADGEWLALVEMNPATGADILILSTDDGEGPRPFIQTSASESHPEISPDGRWLAYMSDESGELQVYVQSFPRGDEKHQISTDRGERPLWSKNGNELFFRKRGEVLSVAVETHPNFRAGRPRVLFGGSYLAGMPVRTYDISDDGQRFLMIETEPTPIVPIEHLEVVLGWAETLEP